jgi:hypothetical protein
MARPRAPSPGPVPSSQDRIAALDACLSATGNRVVITHGTRTLIQTARFLKAAAVRARELARPQPGGGGGTLAPGGVGVAWGEGKKKDSEGPGAGQCRALLQLSVPPCAVWVGM